MRKLLGTVVATALLGAASAQVTLTGAGATFPYPLYAKYFDEYAKLTGVKVNYQSIGSGGGIRQFTEQTVAFGASDAPMTDEQIKSARAAAGGSNVLHIPTALGAVVPAYNLPGVTATLKFDADTLAGIFLGDIKTWNDPKLVALNPEAKLPPLPITVVHRSDGSGTTFVWVDYLTKVSPTWAQKVGRGTSVQWPVGQGAKGNEGVAGVIKQSPGAIGYIELIYAKQNKIPYGAVKNKSGRFIQADLASVREAANVPLPGDARVSITDTPDPEGYPIASFTYLLLYQQAEKNKAIKSEAEAKALSDLVYWVLTDGQKFNEPLEYGRLPEVAKTRGLSLLSKMTYKGKSLR
ncbi:MAG: phosphate ABC transporter substrate-binding protein PstS [Deinococcus sp.]|nr:phosphate ABC transporter substrate-binding protein PstS [Deinococcus sp.]